MSDEIVRKGPSGPAIGVFSPSPSDANAIPVVNSEGDGFDMLFPGEAGSTITSDGETWTVQPGSSIAFAVASDQTGSSGLNRCALYTWEQFDAGGDPEPAAIIELDLRLDGISWGADGSLYVASRSTLTNSRLHRILPENLVTAAPPSSQLIFDGYTVFLGGMAWDIYGRLLLALGPAGPNGVIAANVPNIGGGWPSAAVAQAYKFFDTGQPDGCLGGFQYAIDTQGRLWSTRYQSGSDQDLTRWRVPLSSPTLVTFAASAVTASEFLTWGGSGTAAGGFGVTNATDNLTAWVAPCRGQLQLGFAEKINAAVGADRVFQIRVNGAVTGIDVTITNGQRFGVNGRDVLTIAQGDRVTVACTTTEANPFMVHVQFTPSSDATGTEPVLAPDVQIGGSNWTGIAGVSIDENGDLYASNYNAGRIQCVAAASILPSTSIQNLVPTRTISYPGFTPEWSAFLYDRSLICASYEEGSVVQFSAAQLAAGGTQTPIRRISLAAAGIVNPGMIAVPPWRGPLH